MEKLYSINWEYFIAILSLLVGFVISVGTITTNHNNANRSRLIDVITSNRVEWMQKLKEYVSEYLSLVTYYYEKKLPNESDVFLTNLYKLTTQIKFHLNYKGEADLEITKQLDEINEAYEKLLFLKSTTSIKNEMISKEIFEFYMYQYPKKFQNIYKQLLDENNVNLNSNNSIDKFFEDIRSRGKDFAEEIHGKQLKAIDEDIKRVIRIIKYRHQSISILVQIYLKTEWERVKVEAKSGSIVKYNFDVHFSENKKIKQNELQCLEERIHKE